jgi:nucleoside-diphosphate-sugar epimerase
VDSTRNVMDFCARKGYPRLVYISSSSVFYRHEHQFGLTEDSPIGPTFVNAYAASKYAGEVLVGTYRGQKTILRPRAVFGPGDTVLFPRILAAARKGRLPRFIVDGPPAMGDVIYIDVLCDYMLKAATLPTLQPAYNLTNAAPVEIEAFLMHVLRALDLPLPTREMNIQSAMRAAVWIERAYRWLRLPGEPPLTQFGVGVFAYSKTFDTGRALADFGAPCVSLEEGVSRFVDWQKQQWSSPR